MDIQRTLDLHAADRDWSCLAEDESRAFVMKRLHVVPGLNDPLPAANGATSPTSATSSIFHPTLNQLAYDDAMRG